MFLRIFDPRCFRFSTRILLGSLGPLFLICLSMGVYMLSRIERDAMARLDEKGSTTSRMLAKLSNIPILTHDHWILNDYVTEICSDKEIVFAVVVDAKGRMLTTSVPGSEEGYAEDVSIYSSPIFNSDKQLGTVKVGISMLRFKAERKKDYLVFGAISFATVGLCIVLALSISSVTTRPIHRMVEIMKAVEQGDFSVSQEVHGKDEIAVLARGFNEMLEHIARRDHELEKYHQSLEAMVVKRTEELDRANEDLQKELRERRAVEDALRESEQRVRQKLDSILAPEGDIGSLELVDVIDADAFQSIVDDCYGLTHLPVGIIDIEGKVLVGAGWQDICLEFHQAHPEACRHCIESTTQLTHGVSPGEFRLYKCKNNMWNMATPIVVGSQHVGNLLAGQFFFDDEPLDYELFRSQAARYGFDEREYLAALDSAPRLSRETVEMGMGFLMKFSNMLSLLSYSNIKLARSLTERKRAEEERNMLESQLRLAQKREAVGTLAGGIAHDFNNILAAIIGYTELSAQYLLDSGPVANNLRQVLKASYRAKELIKQILFLSRSTDGQERSPIDIVSVLKEAVGFIRASLPATIEIRQSLPSDSMIALADSTQIYQVLMNLCTNAAHAMEDTGGALEVAVSGLVLDEPAAASYPDLRPGPYIQVSVSDTGYGMDRETLERIFDPYFTTKGVGKGSGLGLAVVLGIIKRHDGTIKVTSEPERGSTFHVFIPRIDGLPESDTGAIREIKGGRERILLVDDEEAIQDFAKRLLEHLGYRVATFTSSRDALEAFRENPEQFDLIITDFTMPNLTGDVLAAECLRVRSDIPILLCTGFNERMDEQRAVEMGIRECLLKPLSLVDLTNAVRRALDGENRQER